MQLDTARRARDAPLDAGKGGVDGVDHFFPRRSCHGGAWTGHSVRYSQVERNKWYLCSAELMDQMSVLSQIDIPGQGRGLHRQVKKDGGRQEWGQDLLVLRGSLPISENASARAEGT